MDLAQYMSHINSGKRVIGGSAEHECMHAMSQEAMQICVKINQTYHTSEEMCALMSELIGKPVDASFGLFPPFTADFGKNITIGQRVFINSGCHFQDQGGITIGDDVLIGHNVVLATLNHALKPDQRKDMIPAPIVIGRNVWIGANATVLPGVTIGDNAIVAAGAVVTRSVAEDTVVGGVPARVIKTINEV